MSRAAKKKRKSARRVRFKPNLDKQYSDVQTLRGFVASQIPSLDSQGPWTPQQLAAIMEIYGWYQRDGCWYCAHNCGRTVPRFGDQCTECLRIYGKIGPVDWDSIGVDREGA